jgi:tRNA-specific 2-thiouridylase
MSGGVDSSLAAALLLDAGRDVFGVTMRLGLAELANRACCGEEVVLLARRACDALGIQHVVLDMATEFASEVVEPFCADYAAGRTPNPCVRCNERIKFGAFLERVKRLGADTLATGHYARIARAKGLAWLERGADRRKDQSYFLYRVPPKALAMLEFPLADLTKREVRTMAELKGLPAAARRESQEVCFTGDHTTFVTARHPAAGMPGPIEDVMGAVLGTHRGIARYTVGQRKGLGLSGPAGPYRVVRIDADRNAVIVGASDALVREHVTLAESVWRLPGCARVLAQVRYRGLPLPAMAMPTTLGLEVQFDTPADGLAPGQSVVLYQGERVIGGGIVPPQ